MNETRRLLVTGASGFVGHHVCRAAAGTWRVYGTWCSRPPILPGIQSVRMDLSTSGALERVFQEVRPHGVIHTAARSSLDYCQIHPDDSRQINLTASVLLARLCADHGIPLVFTSTDIVFDGLNPPYRETDPVSPVNRYGEQKALAEADMRAVYPDTAVCRLSLVFGPAPAKNNPPVRPDGPALAAGRELRLFTDEFRTPVHVVRVAAGLLMALENASGILHLGGGERISRYEFGRLMARGLGYHQARLSPCRQGDLTFEAARPRDVSLDNSRARALGFSPLSLASEFELIRTGLNPYLNP